MQFETVRHEKIRFRRDERTCLDSLPSSRQPTRGDRLVDGLQRVGRVSAGLVVVVGMLTAVAVMLIQGGFGQERMRAGAQAALARLVGTDHRPAIGAVSLTFAGPASLALELRDVTIVRSSGGAPVVQADTILLGLSLPELVRGQVRLGDVTVNRAQLDASALPAGGPQTGLLAVDGVYDPGAVVRAALGFMSGLSAIWHENGAGVIELNDLAVNVAKATDEPLLRIIEHARLMRVSDAEAALEAVIAADADRFDLATSLDLDPDTGRIENIRLTVDAIKAGSTISDAAIAFDALNVTVDGDAADAGVVALDGRVQGLTIGSGQEVVKGDFEFDAKLAAGSGKIELDRVHALIGRSSLEFHGAFGPSPAGSTAQPSYRFELVSDGSTISPGDSSEPSLDIVARLAGTLDADMRQLHIAEIGVRTGQGEVSGSGRLIFGDKGAPGVALGLDVSNMAVAHAKQLWPWFAAPSSRRWVMDNLYGGTVESGRLDVDVRQNRLGNGVPLAADEVAGRFQLTRTRFDVAGRIPPVRDGAGIVAFAGSDVDIELERGTVYMPSGRTVDAADGRLTVRAAHIKPVIGLLEIDVAGTADAILELASYDPIFAERYVNLSPDALSGRVTGHVKADIPMHKDIPADTLAWLVSLRYDDLAISVPVDGQLVSDASGSIVIDPAKARIEASARLNGIPASLSLVEPLGDGGTARSRRIALTLDDKAREALVPGLNTLVSGDVGIRLENPGPDRQRIDADLTAAGLSIPWIGWSKGAGIPASLSFDLSDDGERRVLSNFTLVGESFAASGTITMAGDRLEAISLPSVRLARNDDFAIELRRRGDSYVVEVRGRSIDARSLVKLYGGSSEGQGNGSDSVAVAVDLRSDEVVGFHGETFRNVSLDYAGDGRRADNVAFQATTSSGAAVTFSDRQDGDGRALDIQSSDAGALLRFLDLYERMRGGSISLALRGAPDGPLRGPIDARNFSVVDEPRIATLVSTPPARDGRSLNQAVRGDFDASVVRFERGYADITRAPGSLSLQRGILRGPMIGATFQGELHDPQGNINLTGTFMPAYGINRIFGEIPLVGALLGNGRDRGLIGITFRLSGDPVEPRLDVNPLSVIAPGIFRSVFEFR